MKNEPLLNPIHDLLSGYSPNLLVSLEPAGGGWHRAGGHQLHRGQDPVRLRAGAVPERRAGRALQQPRGVRAAIPGRPRHPARPAVPDWLSGTWTTQI